MRTHTKEATEIIAVIDSLPEVHRRYLRDLVFRVAAVAREASKSKKKIARLALAGLFWIVIGVSAVSGATPDLPTTAVAREKASKSNGKTNPAAQNQQDDDEDVPEYFTIRPSAA